MSAISIIKVLEGNRITLPKKFVDDAKIKVGDQIGYKYFPIAKKIEIILVKMEKQD